MFDQQSMYWWFRGEGHGSVDRLGNLARYHRYVRAVIALWDDLLAEGPRYGWNTLAPARLWEHPFTLAHVLARLGVPDGRLHAPPPPAGLVGILTMADRVLAADLLRNYRPATKHGTMEAVPASLRLMDAMLAHDVDAAHQLLQVADNVNARDVMSGTRPLEWATRHGYIDLTRWLLERGARVDDRSREDTSLKLAAFGGHTDIVRLLLEWGADPTYQRFGSWDALGYAERHGHAAVVALLREALEHRQDPPAGP